MCIMSYFIIIRGPLGCGKSTLSRRLTKLLNAEYISIDELLEKKGLDKVDHKLNCIPKENFIKVNETIIPSVHKALSSGQVVIFDACFYHKEPIEQLTRELKHPHYIFTLKAPLEVCIKRDRNRKKPLGEIATIEVYKLVSRFDYGIIIDATKTLEQSVKYILSKLPQS